jgi:hypothetical protein
VVSAASGVAVGVNDAIRLIRVEVHPIGKPDRRALEGRHHFLGVSKHVAEPKMLVRTGSAGIDVCFTQRYQGV